MKHGDLVTYKGREIGRVKGDLPGGGTAWVVFSCGGDWSRFDEYTAASTPLRNLKQGWKLKGTKWRRKNPYAGEGKVDVVRNQDKYGYVKCRHYDHAAYPHLNEGIEYIAVDVLIEYFYQI